MADIHITRELLLAVHRGELPARLLTQIGLQHLLSLCSHCRREFERFRREVGGQTRADAAMTARPPAIRLPAISLLAIPAPQSRPGTSVD